MTAPQSDANTPTKMPRASFAVGFCSGALGAGVGVCTMFSMLALSPDVSLDTARLMGLALSSPISMAAHPFISRELYNDQAQYRPSFGWVLGGMVAGVSAVVAVAFFKGFADEKQAERFFEHHSCKKTSQAPAWYPAQPLTREMTGAQLAARAGLKLPNPA